MKNPPLNVDKRVGINRVGVLVPIHLLGQELVAVGVEHPDVTVEFPEHQAREIARRVSLNCRVGPHAVVKAVEFQPLRKEPEGLVGLVIHQPERRHDLIARNPRV